MRRGVPLRVLCQPVKQGRPESVKRHAFAHGLFRKFRAPVPQGKRHHVGASRARRFAIVRARLRRGRSRRGALIVRGLRGVLRGRIGRGRPLSS